MSLSMEISVRELITRVGVDEISAASQKTLKPVSPHAVHKWRKNGIPDDHWAIFVEKAGVTVEDIYRANERLRDSGGQKIKAA